MGSVLPSSVRHLTPGRSRKPPLLFDDEDVSRVAQLKRLSSRLEMTFPMYVISVPRLLRLERMEPHQKLHAQGLLEQWGGNHKGRTIFVSHEWVGFSNADPNGTQMSALQGMLRNLMTHQISQVEVHAQQQSDYKENVAVTAERWALALPWMYIWLDFLSIPQVEARTANTDEVNFKGELAAAVDSIPAYVERCSLMVILAPLCCHSDKNVVCSYGSWRSRGWCRLELQVTLLSDTRVRVMVCEGSHVPPYFIKASDAWKLLPGDGEFTCCHRNHVINGTPIVCDRSRCTRILKGFLKVKNEQMRKAGFIHKFRQCACLYNWLSRSPILDALEEASPADLDGDVAFTAFDSRFSKDAEEDTSSVERLKQGLSWCESDDEASNGRTLIYYATLANNEKIVEELIRTGAAGLDDIVLFPESAWGERKLTPLMAAMVFSRFQTVEALLRARADVETETPGGNAFTLACSFGRADNVQAWMSYFPNWNLHQRTTLGLRTKGNTALMSTAQNGPAPGAAEVAQLLLGARANVNDKNELGLSVLHCACTNLNMVVDLVDLLIRASADVNCQAISQTVESTSQIACASDAVFSGFADSLANDLHHYTLCTPLMLAIEHHKLAEAELLVDCRAELTLKNRRSQTAIDLALENLTPQIAERLLGPLSALSSVNLFAGSFALDALDASGSRSMKSNSSTRSMNLWRSSSGASTSSNRSLKSNSSMRSNSSQTLQSAGIGCCGGRRANQTLQMQRALGHAKVARMVAEQKLDAAERARAAAEMRATQLQEKLDEVTAKLQSLLPEKGAVASREGTMVSGEEDDRISIKPPSRTGSMLSMSEDGLTSIRLASRLGSMVSVEGDCVTSVKPATRLGSMLAVPEDAEDGTTSTKPTNRPGSMLSVSEDGRSGLCFEETRTSMNLVCTPESKLEGVLSGKDLSCEGDRTSLSDGDFEVQSKSSRRFITYSL